MLLCLATAALAPAAAQPAGQDPSSNTSSESALQQDNAAVKPNMADPMAGVHATKIIGLCDGNSRVDGNSPSSLGLNDVLWVVVETSADAAAAAAGAATGVGTAKTPAVAALCKGSVIDAPPTGAQASEGAVQLDAGQYALFFNGRELEALDGTVYDSSRHAFGFRLTRNGQNKALWTGLLGAPTTALHRSVVVALGMRANDRSPLPTISGNRVDATLQLRLFSGLGLAIAVAGAVLVLYLVWGHAKKRATLRDNLLPQLEPARQPYSLARWQMAFWFTLIFTSFLFLFILLWDTNTITTQALSLMGISSATALASVSIDVAKDSPADTANRELQALGLNHYADVLRMQQEIADRKAELAAIPTLSSAISPSDPAVAAGEAAAPAAAAAATDDRRRQLQAEIQARTDTLRTYAEKIRPFVSQGWFTDLTSDLNGTALHRLQVLCWTITLGLVFLISVYRELAMPDFNSTLLGLMGISSAGYVGFKIPELNN
jgi:hypothetical protein